MHIRSTCTSFLLLVSSLAFGQGYAVEFIEPLPGHGYSALYGINNSGDVVGSSHTTAFIIRGGQVHIVNAVDGYPNNLLVGLNDFGHVIGNAMGWFEGRPVFQGYRYTQTGGFSLLAWLPQNSSSSTAEINNAGQIIGTSHGDDYSRAVVWQRGDMTDLGILPGALSSEASGINEHGVAVGNSFLPDGIGRRAVVFHGGQVTDIGGLPNSTGNTAHSINFWGQIVGSSQVAGSHRRGFLYDNGVFTDLGMLPNSVATVPIRINRRGFIIGRAEHANGFHESFLHNGRIQDIRNLAVGASWRRVNALDINDFGVIVGYAEVLINGSYQQRGFILRPVRN